MSAPRDGNPSGRRAPPPAPTRYSLFVSAMKIALPLGAIGLIATVLVYSGVFDSRDRLDISFREIATLNNDLRMVSPRVSGLDRAGRPYMLTADTATQATDRPSHVTLDNLRAELMLDGDADWVTLSSVQGLLDTESQTLDLHREIDIHAASGYEFHATSARVDFRQGTIASSEAVAGQGPLGTLRADAMTADNEARTLRFEGRVKVRIYPEGEKGN